MMERTKKKKKAKKRPDGKVQWIKMGRGSLRRGGKIIKPGQKFWARPDEISKESRDVIVPCEDLPEEEALKTANANYSLKHRGGGYYDVVNEQQKRMNENALRKDAALELIKSLE